MGVSTDKLSQAFSLALEQRSNETVDLVTDSNVLLKVMKDKGLFKTYSGPTIRHRLNYAQTGSSVWYSGYKFLNPKPGEYFYDAEYTPKMLAVSATMSGEEILQNSGVNQLKELMASVISIAQGEIRDVFTASLHSNGAAFGGEELVGLQAAIPTANTAGTYAGIARSNAWWQTSTYDADTDFGGIGTQVSSTTIRAMYEKIMIERSLGKNGPDLILADQNHYTAFSAALNTIQRVTDDGPMAQLGFPALKFAGAGRSVEVVLEGGIGTNMPSNVTYFIDTKGLAVRYHPDRYFKPFNGRQTPINQDAVVQHIGFMGELTLTNPRHMAKFYDSDLVS